MRPDSLARTLTIGVALLAIGPAVQAAAAQQETLESAFQSYCGFLEAGDWQKGTAVAEILDDAGKDLLVQMLSGDDRDMKLCAWMLLSEVGDVRVVPSVAAFIGDPAKDPRERSTACEWIKGIATRDALSAMLSVLSEPLDRDTNSGLKMCAVQALGGIDDSSSRGRLEELLTDSEYAWLRSSVIEALGRLRDTEVVDQLIVLSESASLPFSEKYSATVALAAIGTPESVVPLLAVVQSLPPGPDRYELGTSVARRLENAKGRTQDPEFTVELEQLIENIRSLALERPL